MSKDSTKLTNEELVEKYSKLVYSIANKLRKRLQMRIAIEDIEAYGFQGLLEAYQRFDPEAGTAFSSFAYYRIRGAILDGCRREGWISHHVLRRARSMNAMDEYLEAEVQVVSPAPRSLAESLSRVTDIITGAAAVVLVGEHEEFLADDALPDEAIEKRQDRQLLKDGFKLLTAQEREVLTRYYHDDEPMIEIGRHFGHSKSWVSRIHTRAIDRIRDHVVANTS